MSEGRKVLCVVSWRYCHFGDIVESKSQIWKPPRLKSIREATVTYSIYINAHTHTQTDIRRFQFDHVEHVGDFDWTSWGDLEQTPPTSAPTAVDYDPMGPAHRVKTCEDVSFEFVQLFVFFSCQSLLCKILTSKSNNCTGLRLQKLSESNFQSFVVQVKFAKMLAVICNLCCNGYCNLWYYGYIVDLVLCTSLSDDPLARDDTRRGVFTTLVS